MIFQKRTGMISYRKECALLLSANFLIVLGMIFYYNAHSGKTELDFHGQELRLVRQMETDTGEKHLVEEPGDYLDPTFEGYERRIESPIFELARGLYTVTIKYQTEKGWGSSDISDFSGEKSSAIQSSGINLKADTDTASYLIYCDSDRQQAVIKNRLSSDSGDYLLINEIELKPERPDISGCIVTTVLLMLLTDMLLAAVVSQKDKISPGIWLGLILVFFLASGPLFTDVLIAGDDLRFHLTRIEGIKNGLLSGSFPVKIQPSWMNGNGYAAGVMYGDIFLYLPACLRMIHVPVYTAYKVYVFLINLLTVGIAFFSFSGMTEDNRTGLLGCTLYTLSLYRMADVYTRAAVGEYTAMAFYPLVLYGMYLVFKKKSERAIPVLVAGFSGILQSHILSCEMAAIFCLLACLIFRRKTFTKRVMLIYLKTAGWLLCLNAWFWVPFLDYYFSLPLGIKRNIELSENIQKLGLSLPKLFSLSVSMPRGIGTWLGEETNAGRSPCTVGIAFTFVLLLYFLYEFREKKYFREQEGRFCISMVGLALFLSTAYFPYDWLCDRIPVLGSIIKNIQFPWRFLAVAVVMLSWLSCILVRQHGEENRKRRMICMLCITAGLQYMYSGEQILRESETVRPVYDLECMLPYIMLVNEYTLEETNTGNLLKEPVGSEGTTIGNYEKDGNHISIHVENTRKEGYIELPLLFYKGYRAVDGEGRKYEVTAGANNQLRVELPEGIHSLRIRFAEPLPWRIAEMVSVLTAGAAVTGALMKRKKNGSEPWKYSDMK